MGEVSTIGLDIAKSVFQIHGVDAGGAVVIRKRITRAKLLEFFAANQAPERLDHLTADALDFGTTARNSIGWSDRFSPACRCAGIQSIAPAVRR